MNNKDVSNDNLKAFKEFVNKIVDLKQLVFRLWISLWIVLFILLIMKYCFGVWYPIVVDNEIFIKICNFIDDNIWFRYIILSILYILSCNIYLLTSTNKKKYNRWYVFILINLLFIGIFIIKCFNSYIAMILEFLLLIIIPTIFNIKHNNFNRKILNILFPLCFYLISNLWQLNALLVRDLPLFLTNASTLFCIIMQLDYYVFLIISWIGVSFMGLSSFGWFFGKTITDLEAMKKEEIAKSKPDLKLIADIDEAIRKKKEKENKNKK